MRSRDVEAPATDSGQPKRRHHQAAEAGRTESPPTIVVYDGFVSDVYRCWRLEVWRARQAVMCGLRDLQKHQQHHRTVVMETITSRRRATRHHSQRPSRPHWTATTRLVVSTVAFTWYLLCVPPITSYKIYSVDRLHRKAQMDSRVLFVYVMGSIRCRIYPVCRLSFWLTPSRGVLSESWCCPSSPCVVFLACVHLALFLALSQLCFLMVWLYYASFLALRMSNSFL